MRRVFILWLVALVSCAATDAARAQEDSPATRRAAAERYEAAVPFKDVFQSMMAELTQMVPSEKRSQFAQEMAGRVDVARIRELGLASMVEHFTTDELNALADFYGSEVGRSVMSKMGAYMADAMPTIQAEIMRALAAEPK